MLNSLPRVAKTSCKGAEWQYFVRLSLFGWIWGSALELPRTSCLAQGWCNLRYFYCQAGEAQCLVCQSRVTLCEQLWYVISHSKCCIWQVAPWNRLCDLKILARYLKNPNFVMILSNTKKDFLVSSKPPHKNIYLKAVNYVINYMIHGKLRNSRKTTLLTENYVIHGACVESM